MGHVPLRPRGCSQKGPGIVLMGLPGKVEVGEDRTVEAMSREEVLSTHLTVLERPVSR